MIEIKTLFRRKIAEFLGVQPNQISTYWKGRVGLYALLKAMDIGKGDEVVLPAFTCVVVPNAIIYLGAKPVYADIDETTLNPDLNLIKGKVTEKTKCIIIQNTFGLSSGVDSIVAFARSRSIYTIEDCTHGFGGTYKGKPNGTYCDAAFYSTQWNKPFSTGIGGFVSVNNKSLLPALNMADKDLVTPSFTQRLMLNLLIRSRNILLNDATYWTLLRLYRTLSKAGMVVGSSSSSELSSPKMPERYFASFTDIQAKTGVKALEHLDDIIELRRKNGKKFNAFLRKIGKWNYPDKELINHSFLKYPIFVKDKAAFQEKAESAQIRLGDWFLSPIHPVEENFSLWYLDQSKFPAAVQSAKHILNLSTDTENTNKVIEFLKKNQNDLL